MEGNPDIASALARVDDSAPIIAFTHNPDIFPSIPAKVALTIAGHTHGGQVAFPVAGRPIVPSDFGERYAAGHIVEDSRHLFVTSGIGTSILPVRFRVPPEISLLTIN
jgi:predicted MPP superfamily phosphohydrolase